MSLSSAHTLLVQIDGRTVYSPFFAGVFWDAQDVMLEDIDRIEVISGPGGTMWGANAVNGVINILTKSSASTQGVLASGGGGDEGYKANGALWRPHVGRPLPRLCASARVAKPVAGKRRISAGRQPAAAERLSR